jgi:hypothetical protein
MTEDFSQFADLAAPRFVTLVETEQWQDLLRRENELPPEGLLTELLQKHVLTPVELMWVVRALLVAYGQKNSILHRIPGERLSKTISSLLRILFLLLDNHHNEPDANLLIYLTAKIKEACWGLTEPTAKYLQQL